MDGPCDYGHFDIVLADFLKQNSISKNQLSEKANLQRTQLNSYCKNNIKRPDLDVLARICYALNCELSDIIRYVHPNERNGEKGKGRSFFIRQKKEVRKTIGTLVECGISDVEAAGSLFGNSLRKADESPDGSALRRPLFKKMIPAVDLPFFLSGVIVY